MLAGHLPVMDSSAEQAELVQAHSGDYESFNRRRKNCTHIHPRFRRLGLADRSRLENCGNRTAKGTRHLALRFGKLLARGTVLHRMTNWKSLSLGQASANVLPATWVTMNGWLPLNVSHIGLRTPLN